MRLLHSLFAALLCAVASHAKTYTYVFDSTPLSEALTAIAEEHPSLIVNFIYNELGLYSTSASIDTDDPYQALRLTIGQNPVSITVKGNRYYIEALQHGKYAYAGRVVDTDGEPVVGASVMLLSPRDSTVITYGISDPDGHFSVPCDQRSVLAKLSCVGYHTAYINDAQPQMGRVTLQQSPVMLSNISVETDNATLSAEKNTYIPTSRQKNASIDATDLLRRMAIPHLIISPADDKVTDVFGNAVRIYINHHPAEYDEIKNLKLTDVRKVEFIEYPADPRFNGELRVVNIIAQEYEYGGYTKVSESFASLNGSANEASAFSRFTYKKMTYDLYAGAKNADYRHTGVDNSAQYLLENHGEPLTVNLTETFSDSRKRSDEYPLTLRASYSTPRFSARNTVSFSHNSTPEKYSAGRLTTDIKPQSDYAFERSNPHKHNYVYCHSYIWGLIRDNLSYTLAPSFNHTHRNEVAFYSSTLAESPIDNHITENAYNWAVQATARLAVGKTHQFMLNANFNQFINNLTYTGTNASIDSYLNSFLNARLQYRLQTKKLSVSASLGILFNHNSMNGITTDDLSPTADLSANFMLNDRNQISATYTYNVWSPGISLKANDVVQSNEFMYLTGNPLLKNSILNRANVAYNRYCSRAVSLAAFAGFSQYHNRVSTVYRPYADGSALIRDFINDGDYLNGYIGLQINCKLLDNSLQLYANVTENAYRITGLSPDTYSAIRVQMQAAYYWKAFNAMAVYASPHRTLTENSNIIIRGRGFHRISVGWGNGSWAVSLMADNIFHKGWLSETWHRSSPLYSECQRHYSPTAHPSLRMTVTYTVGYGKKVQRGNEVGAQSSSSSAIVR